MEELKFDVPILQIANEYDDKPLDVLVEPHFELFQLAPGKLCDVYYFQATDNTDVGKALTVSWSIRPASMPLNYGWMASSCRMLGPTIRRQLTP